MALRVRAAGSGARILLWTGHANRGVCLGENRVRVVLGGHLQRGTRDVVVSVANNGSTLGSETDYGYNISLGQASKPVAGGRSLGHPRHGADRRAQRVRRHLRLTHGAAKRSWKTCVAHRCWLRGRGRKCSTQLARLRVAGRRASRESWALRPPPQLCATANVGNVRGSRRGAQMDSGGRHLGGRTGRRLVAKGTTPRACAHLRSAQLLVILVLHHCRMHHHGWGLGPPRRAAAHRYLYNISDHYNDFFLKSAAVRAVADAHTMTPAPAPVWSPAWAQRAPAFRALRL